MCARNHIQRSFLDIILKYGLSLCFFATILVNLIQLNSSYLEAITSEWEYLILKLIFFCVNQFIHLKMFTKLLVAKDFFLSFSSLCVVSFLTVCILETADFFNIAKPEFPDSISSHLYLQTSQFLPKLFRGQTQPIKTIHH